MRTSAVLAAALVASALAADIAHAVTRVAESSVGRLRIDQMAGPFQNPWALAFLPSGDMLVTERPGRLNLVTPGGDVTEVAGLPNIGEYGQGGLLDVAIARDFESSGRLFFAFAEASGGQARTAVARATMIAGDAPRLEDVTVIFRQDRGFSGGRHFGARIVVDDDDMLFVTLGDRGQRPLAQDLSTHVGKIVRISPTALPLADNPLVGRANALPEIWSYGHRNVQGAALDPETGDLWSVEHGAKGGDEINRPRPGRNYGWPVISYGRHYSGAKIGQGAAAPGMEQPVYYWDPSIAPSGLMIYDGDMFPAWKGDIFVGALRSQLIARLDRDSSGKIIGEERLLTGTFGRIRDVRVDGEGAIWFLTDEVDGMLYRIAVDE